MCHAGNRISFRPVNTKAMRFPSLLALWLVAACCFAQPEPGKKRYQLRTVAFYNLENLFDTSDDPLTRDKDRTPQGPDRWTQARLALKLQHLARVLADLGSEFGVGPPDLIGVCEAENRDVLKQLTAQPALRPWRYGILHFESPDPRGIDVALLYRKDRFFPEEERSFRLLLYDSRGRRKYTRDQLLVKGFLDQEVIFILVNHWPSRGGAALQSRSYRKAAALRQRGIIDSILYRHPEAKIISMGDFNDNPTDPSMEILSGRAEAETYLYNPMSPLFRRGVGSLAYRDRWNLFDQILFSKAWLEPRENTYRLWRVRVFQPAYLKTREGRYRGYPFRTYAGGRHQGGYSDHFPVVAYLIR